MGRSETCDLKISQNTISREQCRFSFEMDENEQTKFIWKVYDGNDTKESSNGTWLCLTDYRVRQFKAESPLEPLSNNSEIKVSDIILKVEWNEAMLM